MAVVVAGDFHGGSEPTGVEVVADLRQNPPEGVLLYDFHPEAVAAGRRFLGKSELGMHFRPALAEGPDERLTSGDPEDQRAYQAEQDLNTGEHWLGITIHDSPIPNANYLFVGTETTEEVLGIAAILGIIRVVCEPNYPFFQTMPWMVNVEATRSPNNPLTRPEYWRRKLKQIVELGAEGLRAAYRDWQPSLNFYSKVSLPIIRNDGSRRLDTAFYDEVIFHLERMEPKPHEVKRMFEPIQLPPQVVERLGLQGQKTTTGTWGYFNNSKDRDGLGALGGSPNDAFWIAGEDGFLVPHPRWRRREYFGALHIRIPPPKKVGAYALHFATESLPTTRLVT
jgi:hypothetical protein